MKMKKNVLYITISAVALLFVIFLIAMIFRNDSGAVYINPDVSRPVLGNPSAKVKVVEFSDLQCPACKVASTYHKRLLNEFGNDISFEFKHFPLSFHKFAFNAAEASECANDQGKFYEFVEIAFENQQNLAKSDLKDYAKTLSLDTEKFDACLESDSKRSIVESYMREGYALNIPGTPTFFVNDKMVTTINYDEIAGKIREELAAK